MKQARFRSLCILLSLIGVVAGFVLPILQFKSWGVGFSLYQFVFEIDALNVLGYMKGTEVMLLLFVPFILGVVTAVFCLMKSRPIKTILCAVSAGSMIVLPMMVKSFLLKNFGGSDFGHFLGGLFESAYNKYISYGAGFYIFVVCFGLCFLFCILGVRNVQLPYFSNTVKVRCPKCNALNEENAAFCGSCGEKLTISTVNDNETKNI